MASAAEPLALNPELTQGITLSVSRTIRAPRVRVFAAWTDPAILRHWFGPAGMTCAATEIDLRVGGAYRIEMKTDDSSRISVATGEYTRIEPGSLIQFTWHGCWRPDEVSLVTVRFRDAADPGATEVTILHERIAADDAARGYEQGWLGCMTKLDAYFSN